MSIVWRLQSLKGRQRVTPGLVSPDACRRAQLHCALAFRIRPLRAAGPVQQAVPLDGAMARRIHVGNDRLAGIVLL